jgi:ketopantoate reductase
MGNLASVLPDMKQWGESKLLYECCVNGLTRAFGKDNPDTLKYAHNYLIDRRTNNENSENETSAPITTNGK